MTMIFIFPVWLIFQGSMVIWWCN